MFKESPAIGIDLGTTYCCVGVLTPDNHVEIIENENGERTTPSYVSFTDSRVIIGAVAKETVFRNPKNVVYDSKRLIGRKFSDKYLQQNLNSWTFKITSDENKTPVINISRKGKVVGYKPHEISSIILKHLKGTAEKSLDTKITDAVITVPAYFSYYQRTATKEAGKLAGLNVLKIINEPTAAALAYIHRHKITDFQNMVIFDLGGGTFDVTILQVYRKCIVIRATSGNTRLGGRDFENNLTNFVIEEIKELFGPNVVDRRVTERVRAKCESLKIKLSTQQTAYLEFSNLLDENDIYLEIDRDGFETVNMHLFQQCIQTVDNCLKDAKLEKTDISKIVLVGGSTRIPKIQEMLISYFDGKELSKAIHPDEAVAYGAAIQAAIYKNVIKKEDISYITEVTPLSLGTDILGERMSFIIPRNTSIPITKTVCYLTTEDQQEMMCFNIYEGERTLVKYNNKLGTTTIKLPPRPPGYSVDVTFHIDENGILEVGAKTETGIYATMTLDYNNHDSQNTNNLIQEAEQNRFADKKKYDIITLWSNLNEYCVKVKAICRYNGQRMNTEEKDKVINIARRSLEWLAINKIEFGSEEEKKAILTKQKEVETICEPILSRYGYKVKNMQISEFFKLMRR